MHGRAPLLLLSLLRLASLRLGAQSPTERTTTLPLVRTVSAAVWRCGMDDALRPTHARDGAACDADFAAAALRAATTTGMLNKADDSCTFSLAAHIERSVGLIAVGDTVEARLVERTTCGPRVLTRDSVGVDASALSRLCPGTIWSWTQRAPRCLTLPVSVASSPPLPHNVSRAVRALDERARKDFAASRYSRAIADAHDALAADSLDGYAHIVLGGAHFVLGHADSAVPELRSGLRSRPGDTWARERLADALLQAHRDSEAAVAADSALDTDGASAYAYRVLGLARAQLGQLDAAIAALTMASRLAPNTIAPHVALAVVYSDAHRWADAETAARAALRIRDEEQAHLLLGAALAQLGRTSEARRELRRTLKLAPWDYDARELLDSLESARPDR